MCYEGRGNCTTQQVVFQSDDLWLIGWPASRLFRFRGRLAHLAKVVAHDCTHADRPSVTRSRLEFQLMDRPLRRFFQAESRPLGDLNLADLAVRSKNDPRFHRCGEVSQFRLASVFGLHAIEELRWFEACRASGTFVGNVFYELERRRIPRCRREL